MFSSSRFHDLTSSGCLARFAVQSIDSFLLAGRKSSSTALFAPNRCHYYTLGNVLPCSLLCGLWAL